jgi:chaperonin cofactor prefoldin
MTLDERIEALTTHLEVLAGMHEDFEKRMTGYSQDVKDAIHRLANVAGARDERLDDHEQRIERLES